LVFLNELPLIPFEVKKGVRGSWILYGILQKDKHMRAHKGQSTVEYILLLTGVIGAIILFTVGSKSPFQKSMNTVFNETTQDMVNVASYLQTNAANGT
jgi:hypothetical protein